MEEQNDDFFLDYYWADPDKEGADRVEDESGNPVPGLSPGTSFKLGYFLTTNFGGETRATFVVLSGIYPDKGYYTP